MTKAELGKLPLVFTLHYQVYAFRNAPAEGGCLSGPGDYVPAGTLGSAACWRRGYTRHDARAFATFYVAGRRAYAWVSPEHIVGFDLRTCPACHVFLEPDGACSCCNYRSIVPAQGAEEGA